MTLADELNKIAELHTQGRLTEDEFRLAKERLLNANEPQLRDPVASAVNTFRRSRADRWFEMCIRDREGGPAGGGLQIDSDRKQAHAIVIGE